MFRFQIRGVEVGIVVLVLIVWAGAIALFFNRWGKIRMLLPYQPDYKEQLKVPGTGVCASANAAYTQHPTQHACSQVTHRYTASSVMRSLATRRALATMCRLFCIRLKPRLYRRYPNWRTGSRNYNLQNSMTENAH